MSPITKISSIALAAIFSFAAQAQVPDATAPVAPAQVTAAPGQGVAPAPLQPVQVTPAEAGLSAKAQELNEMDAQLALALKKLQLAGTSVQQQEADRKLGAVRSGVSSVPELVGVSGVRGNLTAEFLSNNALVRVAAGEWITEEWRIATLSAHEIVLERRGTKARHIIHFGHKPMSASDLAADTATTNPAMTPGFGEQPPVGVGIGR